MRATISFDIELDKVEETMSALVGQQSSTLRVAANILDNAGSTTLLEEVTEAIDLLQEATSQLQQYQNMLVNFEKAKFETILPQEAAQPVANLGDAVANLNKFGNFIDRLNDSTSEATIGEENDLQPQEG